MSLLNTRHPDPLSAAVSIAENRASKAELLREDELHGIAESCARRLYEDVQSFVAFEYAQSAHGEQVPDHVCECLHAAVARAQGSTTPHEQLRPGDRIEASPYTNPGVVVRILRESEEGRDPFGRPLTRYWGMREDTGEEGFVSFGPGGVVRRLS